MIFLFELDANALWDWVAAQVGTESTSLQHSVSCFDDLNFSRIRIHNLVIRLLYLVPRQRVFHIQNTHDRTCATRSRCAMRYSSGNRQFWEIALELSAVSNYLFCLNFNEVLIAYVERNLPVLHFSRRNAAPIILLPRNTDANSNNFWMMAKFVWNLMLMLGQKSPHTNWV